MDSELKSIITELKDTMLNKFDEVNENLNNKIDAVDESLNKKIDSVDESLNKKIDYIDKKQNKRADSLSSRLDYMNNNIARILQEQIKMRQEIKKYNENNERQHRMFEYEINNLKTYVIQ